MIAGVRISGRWRDTVTMTFEELYDSLVPLLRRMAETKFRVPEDESEALVAG
jgi:hypothetical protein